MTNIPIDTIQDFLADEAQFPASKGHRDPSAPAFIFFDDDRELHPDVRAFRDDMANMEEWIAFKEHGRALDERREEKVRHRKVVIKPYVDSRERKTDENPDLPRAPIPMPSKKDVRRGEMIAQCFTRKAPPAEAVIESIEDDFEAPNDEMPIYELCEYANLHQVLNDQYNRAYPEYDEHGNCTNPYKGIELRKKNGTKVTYQELREEQRYSNWLVEFHKNRPADNDRWRKLVTPLSHHLDESDPVAPLARTILRTMKEALPFAPGPAKSTVFRNPDGSRFESPNVNFGKAKASFIARHDLDEEFVSVDRVQYENERHSRYVVGIRRTSDQTPSNYYDPHPVMVEKLIDGEWVHRYQSTACNLYRVPESMTMPPDSHRLTVREFEQAVIAGAETFDSEDLAFIRDFEEEDICDTRVAIINMGDGNNARDRSALTHEESYLYGILQMFEETRACELMLMEDQEPGTLRMHFLTSGLCASKVKQVQAYNAKNKPIPPSLISETVVAILRYVAQDPEAMQDNLLPYVREVLTGDYRERELADREAFTTREMTGLDHIVAEQIAIELAMPKRPAYHTWKDA